MNSTKVTKIILYGLLLLAGILWGLLVFGCRTYAADYRLFEVDRLNLEIAQIEEKRDPYFPDKENWTTGVALNWDIRTLKYLYWNNKFYMDNDYRVRHTGWIWEGGVNIGPWFDLFKQHHSRHMLDSESEMDFPLENRYGVRFHFIGK